MYIDPNTGGTLFQMLATILALFSGFVLLFSSRIRAAIARFRRSIRGEDEPVDLVSSISEEENATQDFMDDENLKN